jgi:polar amino acid transport system substrate-binding protein
MNARPVRFRLVVLVAALALSGVACSDDDDDGAAGGTSTTTAEGGTPGENLDLVADGRLTACTDVPNAPFEFEQDGKFDGIDIELVRAVSGRLGLTAEFKEVDFDTIFRALNAGECDLVASSVRITEERLKEVDFSDGYYEINLSLLVRKGEEAALGDLGKFAGKTIGVQSETTGAAFAQENAEGATIREFTGADELFTALKARQVDGALQDLPVNRYHATTTGETAVATVFTEAPKDQYGFAMKKGSTELKAAIDDALTQVKSDDTYPTILRRFLGDTAGAI